MAFDPITAVMNVANTVLGRVLPDKVAQQSAQAQLLSMQLTGELQQFSDQVAVDKVEAASSSIFVAGWRPFIGWICGTALMYQFLLRPLLNFIAAVFGAHFTATDLQMQDLMTLLLGMLGLGAMRTVEKVNGVNVLGEDGSPAPKR